MTNPAGYLINTKEGLQGEHGFIYDYIMAGNGLFIQAKSPLIEAIINISPVIVRGLPIIKERVELVHGKVPWHLYDLALSLLYLNPWNESYVAITWEGSNYSVKRPNQTRGEAKVEYETLPNTIIDVHSHGTMEAFSSLQDDIDEQGLKLYMVVGKTNTLVPEVELRCGVYGYFSPMDKEGVFA